MVLDRGKPRRFKSTGDNQTVDSTQESAAQLHNDRIRRSSYISKGNDFMQVVLIFHVNVFISIASQNAMRDVRYWST